jgi:hypothetical protein
MPWHAISKEKGIVAATDYFFDCEGVYLKPKTREIVKQMLIENSFYWDQVDKIKRQLKTQCSG